jgi:hypothetical protein
MLRIRTFSLLALLVLSAAVFAQTPIPKGRSQLNFGVGLSSWGIPVYVGFDVGAKHDLSFGAEASFRYKYEKWKQNRCRNSIIGISGNGNYHFNRIFNMPSQWDLYAGLNLGFYIWNYAPEYQGPRTSGLGLGAQVGGRYYFSGKTALHLEFGSGNAFSGGKIGLTIRL